MLTQINSSGKTTIRNMFNLYKNEKVSLRDRGSIARKPQENAAFNRLGDEPLRRENAHQHAFQSAQGDNFPAISQSVRP